MMTPKEIAELAVTTLDGKRARDLKLLRVGDVTVLADYFVICTATSTTQIKSLADELEAVLEEKGEFKLHREGYRGGGGVLNDYGCGVVHLFMEEARQFFGLERLWADGEEVDISALVTPD